MKKIIYLTMLISTFNCFCAEPKLVCHIQDENGDKKTEVEVVIQYQESFHSDSYEYEFDMEYQELEGTNKKFRVSSTYQLLDEYKSDEEASNLIITLFVGNVKGGGVNNEALEVDELSDLGINNKLLNRGIALYCN